MTRRKATLADLRYRVSTKRDLLGRLEELDRLESAYLFAAEGRKRRMELSAPPPGMAVEPTTPRITPTRSAPGAPKATQGPPAPPTRLERAIAEALEAVKRSKERYG